MFPVCTVTVNSTKKIITILSPIVPERFCYVGYQFAAPIIFFYNLDKFVLSVHFHAVV
jgi:hypothetical protein